METIMSEATLLQTYRELPTELQIAVSSYFELLKKNYNVFLDKTIKPKNIRQLGGLEGKIKVPENFDDPIDFYTDYL